MQSEPINKNPIILSVSNTLYNYFTDRRTQGFDRLLGVNDWLKFSAENPYGPGRFIDIGLHFTQLILDVLIERHSSDPHFLEETRQLTTLVEALERYSNQKGPWPVLNKNPLLFETP